ncbi:MAG: zf-HC2 domain-containing protein [Acidobacteriota bacterium]
MKPLTCTATRRRLQAFYDGELPVDAQIAVQAHMDWCDVCAATLEDLRILGDALRIGAAGQDTLSHDEATALTATVVNRQKAERDASFFARSRRMFDDMHLVYAGVGATAATAVCVVIMLSMLRFASFGRPDATPAADGRSDSLAAMLDVLATPGSSADAMAIDGASHARWAARLQAANETAEQDAVFALDAMVTRDGRLANMHRLRTRGHKDELNLIEALSDTVTRLRIEPGAIVATQAPTNSTMVWLVTRTTVRASKSLNVDVELPPVAKKRGGVVRLTPAAPLARA